MNISILLLLLSCTVLFFAAGIIIYLLLKKSFDNDKLFEVIELITEGLTAFIKRSANTLIQVIIYLTLCLLICSFVFSKSFSWAQIFTFFLSSVIMSCCLFISLVVVPKIIPRAIKSYDGFKEGPITDLYLLAIAISFFISAFAISGLLFSYQVLGANSIIGYGLGIMLTAYSFRVGGGIYKTAADIGSNVISRIDKKVPDFDRRNPATLLDISGDFVAKILGFSADIFSSFMIILIACILYPILLANSKLITTGVADKLQQIPLFVVSIAFFVSILACFFALYRIKKKDKNFLFNSIYLAGILCVIGAYVVIKLFDIKITSGFVFGTGPYFSLFLPYLFGVVGTIFIVFICDVLTSTRFAFARKLAKEAEFGAVVTIFNGFSSGLISIGLFIAFILLVLMPSFYFADVYGITMAGLGMVSVITIILSTNIFSSVAASVYKLVALVDENENRKNTFLEINQIGRIAASLGNGFASAVTVISVFTILLMIILMVKTTVPLDFLLYIDGDILAGLIIGVSIPLIFSGFLLRGVNKAILSVINEVKRQFQDIPYLLEGKARPDIIKAVDKNVINAMNALAIPTIIIFILPFIIGYLFDSTNIKLFIGLICGMFLIGSTLGFYWANFGEALNQAKHYIADGNFGGKDSPTYEHILVADNCGDAFKDLLSPSINILIKSIGILTVLIVSLLM
ncbi:sodium/proton-translocating pyrophosphatase [Candidatus Margulisiibacteriota bacterium]